jgi:F0F1-type ATP synthase membrane subunit b/b'
MLNSRWIAVVLGAMALTACEQKTERDVVDAQKDLEETKREAMNDVAEAQAKAAEKVADAEQKLDEVEREKAVDEYGYADRIEYRDLVRRDLAEVEREIKELEVDAKRTSGDAKKKLDNSIVDLKKERDELGRKLDRAGDVTEKEWEGFRKDVNDGVIKLRKELRDALDGLKKST